MVVEFIEPRREIRLNRQNPMRGGTRGHDQERDNQQCEHPGRAYGHLDTSRQVLTLYRATKSLSIRLESHLHRMQLRHPHLAPLVNPPL
ncbi:MAG: hypothetical protein LZF86_100246 [Nitrospira sp.]|nr:MAG: hypothetical protein LZF86_100246 [Nitrospira sp.]